MRGNGRKRLTAEADPALIQRARGSAAAFGELYDLYLDRVYRFCLAHTDTVEQAEDLAEETFTRALDALTRPEGRAGRFEDRGLAFSSWLLRIAANALRDQWRRHRAPVYSLDMPAAGGEAAEPLADRLVDGQQPDPEELVEEWERAAHLRTCLLLLPDDYRRVLELRYWQERGWDEVAAHIGRSEGAAKKLGKRALATLGVLVQEDLLRARLPQLPDDQQQAIRFRYLEGQALDSIAARMGRTVGAIEWLLEMALKRLGEGEHANV